MPRQRHAGSTWLVTLVALAILLFSQSVAAEEVSIDVSTIYAASGEPEVDAALAPLEKELTSGFEGYTRFELLERTSLVIPLDGTSTVELPDDEKSKLEIGYLGRTDDTELLRLDIGLAGKMSVEVKASPGSTFFQAGLLYKDGILILAINARVKD